MVWNRAVFSPALVGRACCCSWHFSYAGNASVSCRVTADEKSMAVLPRVGAHTSDPKQEGKEEVLNAHREQFVPSPSSQCYRGSSLGCCWLWCPMGTKDCLKILGGTFPKHWAPLDLLSWVSTVLSCLSATEYLEWNVHRAKPGSAKACSKLWMSFSWITVSLAHD